MKSTVYVCHCIDTEGPLFESVSETFKRLQVIFGFDHIDATTSNLIKLQNKQIALDGIEEQVAKVIAPEFLNYNDNYYKLDKMLERICSENFRYQHPDSNGNGWLYNWHCVDHLDYDINVRRKDIGYHNIFDYYSSMIKENNFSDSIHWHYHPSNVHRSSHLSSTLYLRDLKFFEIIARRIIDRNWFPTVNRAGYHTERPDSHWLLEQWMPFDVSNQSIAQKDEQNDVSDGRFGDWRRATNKWQIYNPHHDDYQIEGNCRRHIARCLNIGTRFRCIDQYEVNQAFEIARDRGSSILSFTDHDFREMQGDVEQMITFLKIAKSKYTDVDFIYADIKDAMQINLFGKKINPISDFFEVKFEKNSSNKTQMIVNTKIDTFGPQPFLALKTKNGYYYHDNFDFQIPFRKWSYTFDEHTQELEELTTIGIGSNDSFGNFYTTNIQVKDLQ